MDKLTKMICQLNSSLSLNLKKNAFIQELLYAIIYYCYHLNQILFLNQLKCKIVV